MLSGEAREDTHVVHQHALRELGDGVRVTRPVAADREIEQQKKGVVIDPGGALREIARRDPLVDLAVDGELNPPRSPLHGVDVEVVGESSGCERVRRSDPLAARVSGAMYGAVNNVRFL